MACFAAFDAQLVIKTMSIIISQMQSTQSS